ncbi:Uncharacterised protein [Campylobacter geochelonis]|uniref:Uncharacterized protein n=2 Tax=Campylobacter geochelonis TaxID=1780362 RepID=A0A128EC24_9BACT|nr:Uncharacterised protein [Campylobacter geochelonis]CZE46520.1 Uncharacterised protein [Campylobacter geochelonis]
MKQTDDIPMHDDLTPEMWEEEEKSVQLFIPTPSFIKHWKEKQMKLMKDTQDKNEENKE